MNAVEKIVYCLTTLNQMNVNRDAAIAILTGIYEDVGEKGIVGAVDRMWEAYQDNAKE